MSEGDLGLMDLAGAETPLMDTPVETPVEAPESNDAMPEVTPPEGVETPTEQPVETPKPAETPAKIAAREVSKALRELRDAHPDKAQLLKQLSDSYYRGEKYGEYYQTPEDASRAKATFEALGGDEGIANLQQSAEYLRNMDEMAAAGDPKLIDAWAEENPDGFRKAVPAAMARMEQLDGKAFNEIIAPHLVRNLIASGLPDVVSRISWYANKLGDEGLKREVNSVSQWLGQLNEGESRRSEQANDPRVAEIEQGRQQLASREAQIFKQQIQASVGPSLKQAASESLAQYMKGLKIPQAAQDRMANDVLSEIDRTLSGDKTYQANLASLRSRGDVNAISKYIVATVKSVRGTAAKAVWDVRGAPFQTSAPTPTQNGGAPRVPSANGAPPAKASASAAPLQIPMKPKGEDIDWDKDPDRMLFMTGRAYLKNGANAGRLVKWR